MKVSRVRSIVVYGRNHRFAATSVKRVFQRPSEARGSPVHAFRCNVISRGGPGGSTFRAEGFVLHTFLTDHVTELEI